MKMFKIGDIVVIEEVGKRSALYGDGLEGSIVQLAEDQGTYGGASFQALYNASKQPEVYVCFHMQVRKIDRPLKFRGGKVINVEEATSPF